MTRQIAVITSWAILAAAGGSQAAGSPAPNASTNGFQITQRQQDTTIVTVLSADGVAATQLDSSGAPIRGVILRYVDGMTFGLDYSDNTAHAADLASAVAAKLAENQRVASITALPEIGGNVNGALTPPRTFARVPGANQIGGLNALAIAIDAGANKTRIWYSPDLPQIPGQLADQLATLVANCTAMPEDGNEDDREQGHDGCSPTGSSLVRSAARAFVLRSEASVNGQWIPIIDTVDVKQIAVPGDAFAVPPGFSVVPLSQAAPLAAPLAPVSANLALFTGPIMGHPEIYQFYYGNMFSDPANAPAMFQLNNAYPEMFFFNYASFLEQYRVHGGVLKNLYYRDDLLAELAVLLTPDMVFNESLFSGAQAVWWTYGGHDPLYVLTVHGESGGGYHAFAPSVALAFPFFLQPFVHDFLPYAFVHISQKAMALPAGGVSMRAFCIESPTAPGCPFLSEPLAAFDLGTQIMSHEFVEAATDPYPFFGWADFAKEPVWQFGEVADICEFHPMPYGSTTVAGSISVNTYWSNKDHACVPESRPSIAILSPSDGDVVVWQGPHGPAVFLLASAFDPTDGVPTRIFWQIDGVPQPVGVGGSSLPQALGRHTVQATVFDSQSLQASASVSFTVVASPPSAAIVAPAPGASVTQGLPFALRGTASDPQDRPLPDSAYSWSINGVQAATGPIAAGVASSVGSATVTLTVTDSAGLTATASEDISVVAGNGNPAVVITSPVDGTQFLVPISNVPPTEHFAASAVDADGTTIPDARIVWTETIDQDPTVLAIGSGASLDFALSGAFSFVTHHHITCTVTGATGATASDSITVDVGQIP